MNTEKSERKTYLINVTCDVCGWDSTYHISEDPGRIDTAIKDALQTATFSHKCRISNPTFKAVEIKE